MRAIPASVPNTIAVTRARCNLRLASSSLIRCSVSNSFLEYSRKIMVRSKAGWYRCPHTKVGLCLVCQLRANCKSGGRHKPALPTWYCPAASAKRKYICTASLSSSTQFFKRTQMRIKLSCEMSIIDLELNSMPYAGVNNERPGSRNFSITPTTSASDTSAMDAISFNLVGLRIPKFSPRFSVMALNKISQMRCCSSSSSSYASLACIESASDMVPMAS